MLADRLKILQHILTILNIDTEAHQLLINNIVDYVRNMINNEQNTYQYLVYNQHYKLFVIYIDQIIFFQQWQQSISRTI